MEEEYRAAWRVISDCISLQQTNSAAVRRKHDVQGWCRSGQGGSVYVSVCVCVWCGVGVGWGGGQSTSAASGECSLTVPMPSSRFSSRSGAALASVPNASFTTRQNMSRDT
jgi:hypothetical protein